MSEYKIITISRQFGSGGHEIGEKLAERLGIPLYDNQLVTMAAEKLGYTEESVGRADESALNAFITSYSKAPSHKLRQFHQHCILYAVSRHEGVSETDRDHSQSSREGPLCHRWTLCRLHTAGQI